ncbi:DMT family transporter [Robertmurraya kyonggiensis]|uniref:Uncharacterized protein n=1 Tax=Robertmurraya kyonggiensis TaxID=1037680 RepID=A0A4U1D5T7_9BACI|nr:SMR family transporter [Robertmurraya kyonggiensis]TKC16386.1 hypothetical protein FA727_15670 [Robertmurraya kyonggiensis]
MEKKKKSISVNRAWIYVLVGGGLEIVWATGFKYEEIPSLVVLIALLVSFDLLTRGATVIPIGTVYAVFVGIGTIGTTVVEGIMEGGILPLKAGVILFLLLCIIGLKTTSKGGKA